MVISGLRLSSEHGRRPSRPAVRVIVASSAWGPGRGPMIIGSSARDGRTGRRQPAPVVGGLRSSSAQAARNRQRRPAALRLAVVAGSGGRGPQSLSARGCPINVGPRTSDHRRPAAVKSRHRPAVFVGPPSSATRGRRRFVAARSRLSVSSALDLHRPANFICPPQHNDAPITVVRVIGRCSSSARDRRRPAVDVRLRQSDDGRPSRQPVIVFGL